MFILEIDDLGEVDEKAGATTMTETQRQKVVITFGVRPATNEPTSPRDRVLRFYYEVGDQKNIRETFQKEEIVSLEGFLGWCKSFAWDLRNLGGRLELDFHNGDDRTLLPLSLSHDATEAERVFREILHCKM